MPTVIQFDSEDLLDSNIITRFAKHESMPDRSIVNLPLTKEDGSVFVRSRYGEKIIPFQGHLIGDDQEDLEERIDAMKELLSREEKSLVIDWDGATRVYVATCRTLVFDRDHFNISHVPFTGEFVVATGEGEDSASTEALDDEAVETDTPADIQFDLLGSKPARPIINIQGNNWPSGVKGLSIENLDNGEKVDITSILSWGNDSEIEIDFDAKTVNHIISGVSTLIDFYGVLPSFKIGENNIRLTVGKMFNTGTIEDDISDVSGISALGTNTRYAQSFKIPYTNATFRKLRIPVKTFGSPTGDLTARIETDNGGAPSGSVVTNSTFTIAAASLTGGGTMTYYELTASDNFTLQANTTYWLVVYGASFDNSNGAYWGSVAAANGVANTVTRVSSDGGSSWASPISREQAFILYYGGLDGTSDVIVNVDYNKLWL